MQGPRLEISQRLGTTMTLALQQAIALLVMSTAELEEHIEQELETNPTLERVEPEGEEVPAPPTETESEEPTPPPEEPVKETEIDYGNLFTSEPSPPPSSGDSESENVIEETSTHDILLSDHLLEQLGESNLSPEVARAGRAIISRLDADGFLGMKTLEFAEAAGLDPANVELALRAIRSFDPPGVGAFDARDSLLLQLARRGEERSTAWRILSEFFEDLAENKLPTIAKKLSISVEGVKDALAMIRTLDPHPGKSFGASETNYIIPDVVVEKVHGEYIVSLRQDRIPNLRVAEYYQRLYEKQKKQKGEVTDYLKRKIESATWLIKSIEQRQSSIWRVADSIVRHQIDFFEYGPKFLKPMTLRIVADDIGVHESTVSRVTTQKYMQTPRGTFELKYFFTSSVEGVNGEDASSRVAKTMIAELVDAEDKTMPYSDQRLAELVAERGIKVARRTITKYREQLGILSAKQRIVY